MTNTNNDMRLFFSIINFLILVQEETDLQRNKLSIKPLLLSGADKVANAQITFQFRDKKYTAFEKMEHLFWIE